MNEHISKRRLGLAIVPLALGWLSACGVEGTDTAATNDEALTLPPGPPIFQSCSGKSPDATLVRRSSTLAHSPTTYGTSGCPKAYVVDATPPTISGVDDTTQLEWSSTHSRTEVQCTGGTLKLTLQSKAPGDAIGRGEGVFDVPLQWDPVNQQCMYGSIGIYHRMPLPFGSDQESWTVYRFLQTSPTGYSEIDQTSIRNFNGRTLRLIAAALTPAGSTQPIIIRAN